MHNRLYIFRDIILKDNGQMVTEGDLIKMDRLADTLETIASDPASFYNGSLAEDIVADLEEAGTLSD